MKILLAILVSLTISFAGCSSLCQTEGTVVQALDVASDVVEEAVPEDNERAVTAVEHAQGVVSLGHQAVRACELVRDENSEWEEWLSLALDSIKILFDFFDADDVPAELTEAYEIVVEGFEAISGEPDEE